MNRVPLLASPGPASRLAAYLSRNQVETRDDHPFPELRTPRSDAGPEAMVRQLRSAMEALGWEAVAVDGLRVTGEAVTPLLSFRDDVSVEVSPQPGGGSTLRIRSASRVGRADFGANLRHVLDLRRSLGMPSG
ncbi:MAG: DUF1499 domain-containing protein [Chromatiales bacterium]